MKKTLCIILLCVVFLVSCQNNSQESDYKTDVSVKTLSDELYKIIENTALVKADNGWVALNIPIDTDLCEEFEVYISTTGESDLFGVFKATSQENAEKLAEQSENYLTKLEENWISEYLPEELPKIQNAVCKKCGLYVAFFVLEDEARNLSADNFENMLER